MKKEFKKYRNLIAFILLGAIIFFIAWKYLRGYINVYTSPRFIKGWILSFGKLGFIVYVILQVAQVLFSVVPGEVIQGAGGYIFGTFWGTVLSILGIVIGAIAAFLAARKYGEKLLVRILPEKNYSRIKRIIDKPKNKFVIFILFLIPGFPKDILNYISGLTPVRLGEFIVFSTVARIPGVLMTSYVGSNLYSKNYGVAFAGLGLAAVFIIIGLLKGDKLLSNFR